MEIARANMLGVGVSAIDYDLATAEMEKWATQKSPNYVCVATVNALVQSQTDEEFRKIHNNAGLVTPDGMPLVWLSRLMGFPQTSRVYGPDLLLHVCRASVGRLRHYFYGGRPGVAEHLAENLCGRYPGLLIAGTGAPPVFPGTTCYRPLNDLEEQTLIDTINHSGADIVWVGLGTPYQERWMAEHVSKLKASVQVGVGAAFDFHTGSVRQAPRWMQRAGLEWLFRLMMEPRRLWRRYLIGNSIFLWLIVRQALGRRPPPLDA